MLKENVNMKFLIVGESPLLAYGAGNALPVDRSYRHLFYISLQRKTGRLQVYYSNVITMHIISKCQKCNLCKNNIVIDGETASKIKRELKNIITKENKDELMKNKTPPHVTTTIMGLTEYTVHEAECISDEMYVEAE